MGSNGIEITPAWKTKRNNKYNVLIHVREIFSETSIGHLRLAEVMLRSFELVIELLNYSLKSLAASLLIETHPKLLGWSLSL